MSETKATYDAGNADTPTVRQQLAAAIDDLGRIMDDHAAHGYVGLAVYVAEDVVDDCLTAMHEAHARLAALEVLAERVREWSQVPYVPTGSNEYDDDDYHYRNNIAEDAVLEALEALEQ